MHYVLSSLVSTIAKRKYCHFFFLHIMNHWFKTKWSVLFLQARWLIYLIHVQIVWFWILARKSKTSNGFIYLLISVTNFRDITSRVFSLPRCWWVASHIDRKETFNVLFSKFVIKLLMRSGPGPVRRTGVVPLLS